MANLGYTFTPGLANRFRSAANAPGQLGSNASQALQILSLHLPDVLQGHPAAPDDLLRGSGGLTPDTAVRAQTSGNSGLGTPPGGSGVSSPSLNPSPLAIATPAMASLTSAAINPSSSSTSASPFPQQSDAGPSSSGAPGRPSITLNAPQPSTGAQPPDFNGFMQALLGSLAGTGS